MARRRHHGWISAAPLRLTAAGNAAGALAAPAAAGSDDKHHAIAAINRLP